MSSKNIKTTKKRAAEHTAWQASTSLVLATFITKIIENHVTFIWDIVAGLPVVDNPTIILAGLLAAPVGYIESYAKSTILAPKEPYDPENDFYDIGFK